MNEADLQPTLTDGELTLRPLNPEDWGPLFAVASDPFIWTTHPTPDRWQEPIFRAFFKDALSSNGAIAITRAATGEIIGSSRFDTTRAASGEVEIGWTFLSRSEWGGSTNLRAKRLMVRHALQWFDQVIFRVGAKNVRSRKAMEKIGAKLTSRSVDVQMSGMVVTHVVYAIDKQIFVSGPLSH